MKVKYIAYGALLMTSLVFVDFIIHVASLPSWTETVFSYASLCLFPIGFLLIVFGLTREVKPTPVVVSEPEADLSNLEFMDNGFYPFEGDNPFVGKIPIPALDPEYWGTPGNMYYAPFNTYDNE